MGRQAGQPRETGGRGHGQGSALYVQGHELTDMQQGHARGRQKGRDRGKGRA